MANTANFGWETPDDSDLVKDGAAAMRTLGSAIDTSMMDLKGGTSGQVLSKNSNTDMDFVWVTSDDANAIQNAIVDAKGDLITATAADTPARLAVGTNGQVLTADSSTATGLKWAAAAAGGNTGPAFRVWRSGGDQTINSNTWTKIQYDAESFDTNSAFDSTTNYRFTPATAGYYQFNCCIYTNKNNVNQYTALYKNGSSYASSRYMQAEGVHGLTDIIYLNGSTDYVEFYCYIAGGGNVGTGENATYASASMIRTA